MLGARMRMRDGTNYAPAEANGLDVGRRKVGRWKHVFHLDAWKPRSVRHTTKTKQPGV